MPSMAASFVLPNHEQLADDALEDWFLSKRFRQPLYLIKRSNTQHTYIKYLYIYI